MSFAASPSHQHEYIAGSTGGTIPSRVLQQLWFCQAVAHHCTVQHLAKQLNRCSGRTTLHGIHGFDFEGHSETIVPYYATIDLGYLGASRQLPPRYDLPVSGLRSLPWWISLRPKQRLRSCLSSMVPSGHIGWKIDYRVR